MKVPVQLFSYNLNPDGSRDLQVAEFEVADVLQSAPPICNDLSSHPWFPASVL